MGYCAGLLILVLAGAQDAESRLIAVLQSGQGPAEKDRACFELRQFGTARAVPALADLLGDGQLSMSARCALEAMPCPEAGAALRGALAKTSGLIRAGIIDSLGVRRDLKAVSALAALCSAPEALAADSARRGETEASPSAPRASSAAIRTSGSGLPTAAATAGTAAGSPRCSSDSSKATWTSGATFGTRSANAFVAASLFVSRTHGRAARQAARSFPVRAASTRETAPSPAARSRPRWAAVRTCSGSRSSVISW